MAEADHVQRTPAETTWFNIGEPAGSSHAPAAVDLDKDRTAWWETIDKLLKDYEHRKKLWGECHEKTVRARQEWIEAKNQYYACQPPESRAHSLSKKISARENKRTEKLDKYSQGEKVLQTLDEELEDVQRRRQAAIHTLEQLRAQLADLDKDIESAREERAEVLRQAAQEARSQSEGAAGSADPSRGGVQPADADPNFGGEGGQARFLEAGRQLRHLPGFEQFFRLNFPDNGMQQEVRGEAAQGDLAGQRKRAAEAPAAAADNMSVSSDGDLFGGEPVQGSASVRESSMRAARQARTALARNGLLGVEAARRLQDGPGDRGRSFGRERERSRCRAASREAAQEMSTRAIGLYQEHLRRGHAAAAEALVQGDATPRAAEISGTPATEVARMAEYTVYDDDEYYQHMG